MSLRDTHKDEVYLQEQEFILRDYQALQYTTTLAQAEIGFLMETIQSLEQWLEPGGQPHQCASRNG